MSITINEIARLAGVSRTTVSLVLNDKGATRVSATVRQKVLKIARSRGYQPNLVGRGLVNRRSYRIALVVSGSLIDQAVLRHVSVIELFTHFLRGVQSVGHSITLIEADPKVSAQEISRQILATPADGFAFLRWGPASVTEQLLALKEHGRPAVACGTHLRNPDLTWTDLDRRAFIAEAIDRLIQEGHSRIALMVMYPQYDADLMQAFGEIVEQRLGQDAGGCMFATVPQSHDTVKALTRRAVEQVKGLTALIINDNFYGDQVVDTLRACGIEPGKGFRVIGLGNTVMADLVRPRLSHYAMRSDEQAAFGFEALLEQSHAPATYRPRHRYFGPKYIERET